MIKGIKITANKIILALYLVLICIASIFLYVTHNKLYLAGIIIVGLVLFFFVAHFLLEYAGRIRLGRQSDVTDRQCVMAFLISTLICLVITAVWFIAFRPGSYEQDNIAQLKQAISGEYDSWHPIWHTLVFFTLPYKLTGRAESVVVFQMICFSISVGYMFMVLYRYIGMVYAVIAASYVMLNPFTGFILLFPFKDVPFATAGTLAMAMTAQIFFSGGEWSGKWYKCALLGFMLTNATLFRYNGVLLTGMILLALLFNVKFRQWIVIAAGFALTMIVIQGPVYHGLNAHISKTDVVQTVGFPMSIIGNAVKETPEVIDQDIVDFAYSYAPREVWEERYNRGNFNLMKYGGAWNPGVVEEAGAGRIVSMAARCMVQSPQASMDAIFALTDFVYGIDIQDKADIDIMKNRIIENELGLDYNGVWKLGSLFDKYAAALKLRGWNFFRKLGFGILLVIIVILSRLRWTSAASWKRVLICLPILAYDFGTMLLLSGHDARFFFVSFLVCPITIAMGLYEPAYTVAAERQEDT
ncbi:MAG: hypothetical protein IJS12_10435 [Lachnospiraceae bacterium]|nr:hypothetical protein [Lachnospiraceae bacterium]